ncbi:nuclear transport factor 2 family protein [Mucilaginibacter sp. RS28]|uniref:Nuclear transport factor 2 family protein n=1 Tax=Mucilaginibacter straminoryzae TaxID=2932774 RepID=A0A9X2B7W1_9SPHI|nr:nuclear transport factor 2 family protein [Mucilaginibacter straminoryzae]MCJ8208816.1 nuclear transport factor 2 family protein [Mucilaginibacter straminoryzae]
MNLAFFAELEKIHLKAWNEKDPLERHELLKTTYADDIRLYDENMILDGLDAVSDLIGKLITEDPAYKFEVVESIEPLQNGARLYGHINTSGGLMDSMDFFIMSDGKVKHLYAFIKPAK